VRAHNPRLQFWEKERREKMARTFVGLALSSTMFEGEYLIARLVLGLGRVKHLLSGEIVSCLNPSHTATIEALRQKYGIEIPIPESAPKVTLEPGDTLVVLSARFSRRLAEGERYSAEEIATATFEFVAYAVIDPAAIEEDIRELNLAPYINPRLLEPIE
jgi:hypothetical protein